jgi:hypothetical protein
MTTITMVAGLVVFGDFPNRLAVDAIVLALASGLAIVLDGHDRPRLSA